MDELYSKEIKRVFEEHSSRYGSKRIAKSLEREGIKINHKKVSRLMSKLGLVAKGAKKKYRYHKRILNTQAPNLINQNFIAEERNQIWLGDITYIPTGEGFLYLCVFLDTYSRKIVGFCMDKRMTDNIVTDAFRQAIDKEHPKIGLIVHTDQGSQFTGSRFRNLVKKYGGVVSNSMKGNPYDNAMMESFYRTFKRELINGIKFKSRRDAEKETFKYIELYYNSKRLHSALGYVSPREYERTHSQK